MPLFVVVAAVFGVGHELVESAAFPLLSIGAATHWRGVVGDATGRWELALPDAAGRLSALPPAVQKGFAEMASRRAGNLEQLRRYGSARDWLAGGRHYIAPEYDRELGRVALALTAEDAGFERQAPIMAALPPYTQITLIAPEGLAAGARAWLVSHGYDSRAQVVAAQSQSQVIRGRRFDTNATVWLRDALVVGREGRRSPISVPASYMVARLRGFDLTRDDLAYLEGIGDMRHPVRRLPIFVQGGNLAIAAGRSRVLFIGTELLAQNAAAYRDTLGVEISNQAARKFLRAWSGATRTILLPNSDNFFHIDLYMEVLGPGRIGLLDPVDPELLDRRDRDVLNLARQIFERNGFRVVLIPTTSERIRHFRSSTNAVVYTDRFDGRRHALVPEFPDQSIGDGAGLSLNEAIAAAYRAAGVSARFVPDLFANEKGNTHCVLVALD